MKKSIAKIIAASLGLTMALGVGVGASLTSKEAKPVRAIETAAYTLSGTTTGSGSGYANDNTATQSGISWKVNGNIAQNPWRIGGCSSNGLTDAGTIRHIQSQAAVSSHDITKVVITTAKPGSNAVTPTDVSLKVGTSIGNSSISSLSNGSWSTSITFNRPGGADWSNKYFEIDFTMPAVSGTTNKYITFTSAVFYYEVAAVPTNIEVTGEMSIKSYTTVDSWNNSGLTASVTMSDSSDYSGDVDWTYSPTTPAAAVIANDGNEVTGLSVTATATVNEFNDDSTTTGISVNYATVAEGLDATPASGTLDGVIVKGIVSTVTNVYPSGNALYYISDDGTTNDQLYIYNGKYLNNANFASASQIQVGDEVVVYGNLTTHNSTKEFASGSYLLSKIAHSPYIEITDSPFSMCIGDDDVTVNETHENVPVGGAVKWESNAIDVATVDENTGAVHAVSAGKATITAKIVNSGESTVASDSIIVHVIEPISESGSFVKVTKSIDLIGGGKYLINYGTGKVFDGSLGTLDSVSNGIDVEITDNTIAKNNSTKRAYFTLEIVDGNKYLKSASGYYIGRSENSNGFDSSATRTSSYINTITFDGDGNAAIASAGGPSLRYNTSSNQLRFRYYKDATQQPVSLYKFVPSGSQLVNAEPLISLRGTESAGEVTSVSLGFGVKIAVADWTSINTSYTISDYGIVFAKEATLTANSKVSVEGAYNSSVVSSKVNKGSGATPYQSGDYYVFTALVNIVDGGGALDPSDYGTVYCAAPYIVAGGNYYFFTEMRYSVNTLAAYCLANGGSNLSDAALSTLLA